MFGAKQLNRGSKHSNLLGPLPTNQRWFLPQEFQVPAGLKYIVTSELCEFLSIREKRENRETRPFCILFFLQLESKASLSILSTQSDAHFWGWVRS